MKSNKTYLLDFLIGILFTLFFISLGLTIAIQFRPLYYADIKILNLEETTGLSVQVIRENYDALIDYCSPFFRGELHFPTLPASPSGLSHFVDVKHLFNFFNLCGVVSFILLIFFVAFKWKQKESKYLLVSSITAIVLPVFCLLASAINFSKTFELFHKIAFNNDDWLFDPATDPIINLLPETFFLHCALVIFATVILGSLSLYLSYRFIRKKQNKF